MNPDFIPRCPTCDACMTLVREFSRQLMRRSFPNGKWTCASENTDWHLNAERLEREMFATSSPTLRALLERDLRVLLEQARGNTMTASQTEAA